MTQNSALIVFFSGTGGTKRIAKKMEETLVSHGYGVNLFPLDLSIQDSLTIENEKIKKSKYLFVFFPVYSFNAPKPIFEWIQELPVIEGKPTIVVSVSGGGEISINKSSRTACIQALEEKGFNVFYEKMLVMPSNFAITANDDLNMWLLKIMPEKVMKIVEEVINDKNNRIEVNKRSKKRKSELFLHGSKKFGLSLNASEACNSCNWCANNCPRDNIKMDSGKPVFSDKCIMCMRCIYSCPSKAITSDKFRFATLKNGYNLKALENKMKDKKLQPISKCSKGILWIGARKYLFEKE